MRQTRAGGSRCAGGCCARRRDRIKPLKLKPSKAKSTKGYKVHVDDVRNYILRCTALGLGCVSLTAIEKTLNLPNGYVRACLMVLNREGLVSRPSNGLPHDGYRATQQWGTIYPGGGWQPSLVYIRGFDKKS